MTILVTALISFWLGASGGVVGIWYICQTYLRPKWQQKALDRWAEGPEFQTAMVRHLETYERASNLAHVRRGLHDSGRVYPARSDAGPPARISRVRVRSKRNTR